MLGSTSRLPCVGGAFCTGSYIYQIQKKKQALPMVTHARAETNLLVCYDAKRLVT